MLRPMESYDDVINEVQSETWAHTFETQTMLPSKDCLSLRELNVAFQLKIWMQATKPEIDIDNPEDFGWEKVEEEYQITADSKENTRKQKSIYDTIMRLQKFKMLVRKMHLQKEWCTLYFTLQLFEL